ncbi:MAG: hypothetical protein IJ370_07375 [Oscillospiraceae bacterium]|nr:hypothetical protein [Oscillospiraceae bacterium]MBQ8338570.1 hypothetical protein [Oscillospiraceae bacterium]
MTDNEIIKANSLLKKLEEAYNAYFDTSKGMPYDIDTTLRETAICLENSLNEINRQKAEIESLIKLNSLESEIVAEKHKEIERLQGYNENLQTANTVLSNEILDIKAEAVKEFAERLKIRFAGTISCNAGAIYNAADKILKEMVGEDNSSLANKNN